MNTKHRSGVLAIIVAAVLATPALRADETVSRQVRSARPEPARRTVDLVLCLDTSGSMSGLIDAARQKLWAIVNDLALASPTPRLRVALLTYGNDGHAKSNGWVAIETPLTDDLDLVSEKLFEQTTDGGTELVARVLQHALDGLEWTHDPEALKLIFVAGNESADQDPELDFRQVCKRAIERGIMVNAIYCGQPTDQIAPGWREVARRADGHFAAIDHDTGTLVVATPFDAKLTALSAGLNATYVPFGDAGATGGANQVAQDGNAMRSSTAVAASRAVTKSQSLYVCRWDLVDACRDGGVQIEKIKTEELPEAMRPMSLQERWRYLAKMARRRAALREKITVLGKRRDAFIAEQAVAQGLDDGRAFDKAVRAAIRDQARRKGFEFAGDNKGSDPVSSPPKGQTQSARSDR